MSTPSTKVEFQIADTGSWKTVSSMPYYQDQKVNSEIANLKKQNPGKLIRAVQGGMLVAQG